MQVLTSAPAGAPAPADDLVAWIDHHLRGVWRLLRSYGASPDVADDLAQQVFVVAIEKGALGFEPPAAAAFLHRTARLLFLRQLRDRGKVRELVTAVDELWQRDCAHDGGDSMLMALRDCVAALDGRARRAVELCYGGEALDPQRRDVAAAELGLQPNGLKTLLQRVRQQLRACIERRLR